MISESANPRLSCDKKIGGYNLLIDNCGYRSMELENRLKVYFITAIFSVIFAVVGFSYNAWRLEVSEGNSNIRTASFEVLKILAELEQLVYAAHYDKDQIEGNPRIGWVKIGLIVDLSTLISSSAQGRAQILKAEWGNNWETFAVDRNATDVLVREIESVRGEIKLTLAALE